LSRRNRIAGFGSAGLLVAVGVVCAAAIVTETGEILATVLVGLGLVAAIGLVFLEVGLSEDRERERERKKRERRKRPEQPRRRPLVRPPRRRGH
jgi:hypothetical protein